MISSLRGRVLHLDADSLVVDVGGVGFAVAVTPAVTREFHIGDEIVLHTNLIVREDALSLFPGRRVVVEHEGDHVVLRPPPEDPS